MESEGELSGFEDDHSGYRGDDDMSGLDEDEIRSEVTSRSLKDTMFPSDEMALLPERMKSLCAAVALYTWNNLETRLRDHIRDRKASILFTIARSVTKNQLFLMLHRLQSRMVAVPDKHKPLHNLGAALYRALIR